MTSTIREVRRYGHLEVSICIGARDPHASSTWQRDDGKPEVGDRLHNRSELEKIDRLGGVAVRMQIVGFRHVPSILRGSQHHRNISEFWIYFDLRQDLAPTWLYTNLRNLIAVALTLIVCWLALTGRQGAMTALIAAFSALMGALWGERAALKVPGQDS